MKRFRLLALMTAVLLTSLCACDLLPGVPLPDLDDFLSDLDTEQYTDMPDHSGEIGSHDDDQGYHIVNRVDFSYPTGYEYSLAAHSYDALESDAQRELYTRLIDAVYCFSDKKGTYDGEYKMRPLNFSGLDCKEKDVEAALTALLDDHPEIFWMATDFEFTSFGKNVNLTLNAHYTADQVVSMMHELDAALQKYFSSYKQGLSEYEREVAIYSYIISNCTYDDEVESSDAYGDSHPSIYNLYGVMVDHKAVCEGYSRAFDYLCAQVGVDAVCICGTADTENDEDVDAQSGLHMWNAVQLDGDWYWVDCTWDDWDEDEDLGDVFYYLNITDETLSADHTVDKTYAQITDDEYWELESYINNFVPNSCTATQYCYYLREGVILSTPDAEKLADGFVAAVNKERKSLIVIIDNDRYTPDSMADALFEGSQPYYEAVDTANENLDSAPLDADADAVYYTDDDRNMLIFEIIYE